MRLTFFSIKDYRSISKASFDDLTAVTTLIGPNNEGKSNVLEALKICLQLLRSARIAGSRSKVRIRNDDSYDWSADYPMKKQNPEGIGSSVFELHFALTAEEASKFQNDVKSKLNGLLPIELSFGSNPFVEFRIAKPGKGGPALSKKAETICQFIADNLDFAYIPAIRTAETSSELINVLVSRELRRLEADDKYRKLQDELIALQNPVLKGIEKRIQKNLQEFLGATLKSVSLSLPNNSSRSRLRNLARSSQLTIDDGAPTSLERKGDGVKSLVAIGLLTKALQDAESVKDMILLIEEPESHLHPKAIHQLKAVLDHFKQDRQIILTTHCPLLVNRSVVSSNIVVLRNKAKSATKIEEIREMLGVRASDNLRHAALVIVVEGSDDKIALDGLFSYHSETLRKALQSGSLAFWPIGGASKLSFALSHLQSDLCNSYVLMDDDADGRLGYKKAHEDGLADTSNTFFTKCLGLSESEFEDLLDEKVYASYFKDEYSVDVCKPPFTSKKKWSARIRAGMEKAGKSDANGKAWSDSSESRDKYVIAQLVAGNPKDAIHPARLPMLTAMISAVEDALASVVQGTILAAE